MVYLGHLQAVVDPLLVVPRRADPGRGLLLKTVRNINGFDEPDDVFINMLSREFDSPRLHQAQARADLSNREGRLFLRLVEPMCRQNHIS
jgi:hypothetical protein